MRPRFFTHDLMLLIQLTGCDVAASSAAPATDDAQDSAPSDGDEEVTVPVGATAPDLCAEREEPECFSLLLSDYIDAVFSHDGARLLELLSDEMRARIDRDGDGKIPRGDFDAIMDDERESLRKVFPAGGETVTVSRVHMLEDRRAAVAWISYQGRELTKPVFFRHDNGQWRFGSVELRAALSEARGDIFSWYDIVNYSNGLQTVGCEGGLVQLSPGAQGTMTCIDNACGLWEGTVFYFGNENFNCDYEWGRDFYIDAAGNGHCEDMCT